VQLFALHRLEHSLLVEFQNHGEWVFAFLNLGPETNFRCAPLKDRRVEPTHLVLLFGIEKANTVFEPNLFCLFIEINFL